MSNSMLIYLILASDCTTSQSEDVVEMCGKEQGI